MAVTLVTLASIKVAANFPKLCNSEELSIAPTTVKIIGWTIVLVNSIIATFFAVYIGTSSLVFIGIMVAVYLYSLIHKGKLKDVSSRTVKTWSAL